MYDYEGTFRTVRHDGGKAVGKDCSFYNPYADHMKNRAQLEKIINKGEKNMNDKTLASKLEGQHCPAALQHG